MMDGTSQSKLCLLLFDHYKLDEMTITFTIHCHSTIQVIQLPILIIVKVHKLKSQKLFKSYYIIFIIQTMII